MCIASTFHSWYFAWNYQRLTPHTNHPFCLKFFEPIGFVLTYPYHVVRPIINFIYEVYHSQVITTFLWDFNHPQSCSHGVSGFTRFTKVYRPFSSQPRGNPMMQASLNVLEDQKEFSTSVRSQVGIPWPNLQLVPLEKKGCSPPLLSKQKIYPLLGWFWYIFMICMLNVISRADKYITTTQFRIFAPADCMGLQVLEWETASISINPVKLLCAKMA